MFSKTDSTNVCQQQYIDDIHYLIEVFFCGTINFHSVQKHSLKGTPRKVYEKISKKFNLMKNSCYEVKNSIKCTCEFFKIYNLYQLSIICDRLLLTSFLHPTQLVTSFTPVAHKNHEIFMFLSFLKKLVYLIKVRSEILKI